MHDRHRFLICSLLALLALAGAGCRKTSKRVTASSGDDDIFTTDNFPGAPVQDGNVADDRRAFSPGLGDSPYDIVCTHNGDRGTRMVTYRVDSVVYAHHYDGEHWTPPMALRHPDADTNGSDYTPVVHAFVNTSDDPRDAARERDGDCLIFWACNDLDQDGAGPDGANRALFVSSFDATWSGDPEMNYGFDVDPGAPGVYEARRLSVPDAAGENLVRAGLVTDGLCGEARWTSSSPIQQDYRFGDATTGIVVFWHQLVARAAGVLDDTTWAAVFDLAASGDSSVPLVPTTVSELPPLLFGASDTGATARESIVESTYASYNGVLLRRVRTAGGFASPNGIFGWLTPIFDGQAPLSAGEDITIQATHWNLTTGASTTTCLNTVLPDSSPGNIDNVGSDFLRQVYQDGFGFQVTRNEGRWIYGADEGLSCLVTFFGEVSTPDFASAVVWASEGAEGAVAIARIDEETGALAGSARVSVNDPAIVDNCRPSMYGSSRISRNGDYLWVLWAQQDDQGATLDSEILAAQILTTRRDGDGNPVPLPPLAATIGAPLSVSDGVLDPYFAFVPAWYLWQDNLGYRSGQQSDAAVMNIFFAGITMGLSAEIYHVRLVADVDGTLGGESASPPGLCTSEPAAAVHLFTGQPGVNEARVSFNATDAGRDGDVLFAFARDGDFTDGANNQRLFAGRRGLAPASPIEIGSRTGSRQLEAAARIRLVGTPDGEEIGAWNTDDAAYEENAHHGAEFVHVIFTESEVASYTFGFPTPLGSSVSGYALRTRTYRCEDAGAAFGEEFTPPAGAAFAVPFDLDLPFVDPDSSGDADVLEISTCENAVAIVFLHTGHVYYQECDPEDGDETLTGWRQSAPGVSDPALVDDDVATPIVDSSENRAVSPRCSACRVDGTAIFWEKLSDLDISTTRLQVRIVERD